MDIEEILKSKGKIKPFEYTAIMDGCMYDVASINKKKRTIRLYYANGPFETDLSNISKLIKQDDTE